MERRRLIEHFKRVLHNRTATQVIAQRLVRYQLDQRYTNDLDTDIWLALSRARDAHAPSPVRRCCDASRLV